MVTSLKFHLHWSGFLLNRGISAIHSQFNEINYPGLNLPGKACFRYWRDHYSDEISR